MWNVITATDLYASQAKNVYHHIRMASAMPWATVPVWVVHQVQNSPCELTYLKFLSECARAIYLACSLYKSCQTGSLHNQHKMSMVRHLSSRMSSMCVNWQKTRPPRIMWEQLLQNTTTCTCNNFIYNMILDQSHIRLTGDTNLIFGPLFLFSLSFSFLSSNSWFSFSISVIRVLQRCLELLEKPP